MTTPKEDWVRVLHSDTQITRNALFRAKDALAADPIEDEAFLILLKLHAHLLPQFDEVTRRRLTNWLNGDKLPDQPVRQTIVLRVLDAEEKRLGETEALLREFRDKPRP